MDYLSQVFMFSSRITPKIIKCFLNNFSGKAHKRLHLTPLPVQKIKRLYIIAPPLSLSWMVTRFTVVKVLALFKDWTIVSNGQKPSNNPLYRIFRCIARATLTPQFLFLDINTIKRRGFYEIGKTNISYQNT